MNLKKENYVEPENCKECPHNEGKDKESCYMFVEKSADCLLNKPRLNGLGKELTK